MVSFFKRLTALVSAVAAIGHVAALPTFSTSTGNSVVKRATIPAAPRFVLYSDKWVSGETGPPAPSTIVGYNVFALSFWLSAGPADQAVEWSSLTAANRQTFKTEYSAAGISLIVSAFGSTEAPTSSGEDPTTTANNLAAWVIQYDLDGVDVDYEDFNAINAQDGSAETWLSTFTTAIRAKLPQGQYILTHAPVAPWFSSIYTTGAYLKVDQNVGSLIDWYNIQFYNQGTTEYTTCAGLLNTSSTTYPDSALFQINTSGGVSLDKLVIGKPATAADANNGYIAPATLATCVLDAKNEKWDAGVMVWEYPDAAAAWISSVRSLAFPL
ncbi:glycoside hydrolase family 18 protein [Serpula lacrymans var. lacrymans S7.9]|uniref:Glycoside hydrolase family 18 protein n=1 Tax=Serpula lacrymans var. lacrymans (strain S7.9) TaxID=578457 RepID=F8P2K3_SERL9|nr:glycoside hydrolase family 18 protein [Serpula lacrymans var. lacrymans S7.9]EGO22388.1 glycoside hydrolase family 18 protein [Serpula lacrymans var. lacrymans S7.9]